MRANRRTVSLLAAFLGLAACSDATSPRIVDDPLADEATAMFDIGPAGTTTGGACAYTDGEFVCPSQSRDGLTMTRTFAFYDAAGNAQQRPDPITTASHRTSITVTGTIRTPRGPATINRAGTMIISGLAGTETTHTLNGTEGGSIVAENKTPTGQTFTTTTTIHDTTSNLVVPVGPAAGPAQRWPLSGFRVHTSTTDITGINRPAVFTAITTRIKETFNGTSIVTVEITTPAGTRTCTRDLAAPRQGPVCVP
jgi:hypothetical protein